MAYFIIGSDLAGAEPREAGREAEKGRGWDSPREAERGGEEARRGAEKGSIDYSIVSIAGAQERPTEIRRERS